MIESVITILFGFATGMKFGKTPMQCAIIAGVVTFIVGIMLDVAYHLYTA